MQRGSNFAVDIPKKYLTLLRCRKLRNPFYEEPGSPAYVAAILPWRRIALFLDPPSSSDEVSFNQFNPFPTLCRTLDIPESESMDELAMAVAERLSNINKGQDARNVRRTCFMVNEIHCDAMEIHLGPPDLDKYQGHPFMEAYGRNGDVVRIATIEPHRVYRKGSDRLESYREKPEIHPLAALTAKAIFGRYSDARFDHLETGPWGLRAGILGWNSRAMNLGTLFGEIFAMVPEVFDEPKTGVFTDQYGRATTFYGWVLTSNELTAPDVLCRILELIGVPGHKKAHIHRANKDVLAFLEEAGVQYSDGQKNVLAMLFWGFLYLTPEEWQSVTAELRKKDVRTTLSTLHSQAQNAGLIEVFNKVANSLSIQKLIGE